MMERGHRLVPDSVSLLIHLYQHTRDRSEAALLRDFGWSPQRLRDALQPILADHYADRLEDQPNPAIEWYEHSYSLTQEGMALAEELGAEDGEPVCFGHLNGFAHLKVGLDGIERAFDLGIKFEQRESDEFEVDPRTGIKAWAGPFLALYVSYSSLGPPPRVEGTLHYALWRSKWSQGTEPSAIDEERLLGSAKPLLANDLLALKRGEQPATEFRYL